MRTTTLLCLIASFSILSILYGQNNGHASGLEYGIISEETAPAVSSTGLPARSKETYSLQFGAQFVMQGTLLFLPYDVKIGDRIIFTDMKGKRVLGYSHEVPLSKIAIPNLSHGAYVVSLYRQNRVLRSNSVMVGNQK